MLIIIGCFCSINFCFCFLERTCIFLNNMFFAFFPFFKKREKLVVDDGGVEENIFFSLNKRNVSESIFFPALLIRCFFSSFLLMFKK